MSFIQDKVELIEKKELKNGIFDYKISSPEIAGMAMAGQFLHILCPSVFLRRPISICEIDKKNGTVRFVFQVKGNGTAALAEINEGEKTDVLGPIGNGFEILPKTKPVLVGGGIGVPPLLELAKELKGDCKVVLGFRSADFLILEDDFKATGAEVFVMSDDGSCGGKGLVTEKLEELDFDYIYSCGPMPMLKAVQAFAEKSQIESQLSLEERMGCGVGACLVCACKTNSGGSENYSRVCKEGPVFKGNEVVFDA